MKLGRRRNDHKGRAAIRHYANQPEIFANLRIAFVSSSNVELQRHVTAHNPHQFVRYSYHLRHFLIFKPIDCQTFETVLSVDKFKIL